MGTTENLNLQVLVEQDSVGATGEGTWRGAKGNKMGFQIVTDFFTQMAIEQRVFQIRAGDIATPLIGDVPIADTKCEYCADCIIGTTIIPVHASIGVTLEPGTANQIKIQSVGVVSSAGTAFVPLNTYLGGRGAASSGRVAAAGGVTVTAEAVTTTRLHYANGQGIAAGAYLQSCEWNPKAPPVLVGPACCYVQIGATTTGPSYFANLEYIELPTDGVS
ncbi:MAG TPA: hypothetical protein VJB57_19355 [Dehalococcoidia bacterium]|nr:hypothetical protein [Dehalococcoidia bacterium]